MEGALNSAAHARPQFGTAGTQRHVEEHPDDEQKEQHAQKRNEHEPQVQLHEAEGKTNRGEGGGHGEERLVHDNHAEKRQRVGRDEAVVGPLDRT